MKEIVRANTWRWPGSRWRRGRRRPEFHKPFESKAVAVKFSEGATAPSTPSFGMASAPWSTTARWAGQAVARTFLAALTRLARRRLLPTLPIQLIWMRTFARTALTLQCLAALWNNGRLTASHPAGRPQHQSLWAQHSRPGGRVFGEWHFRFHLRHGDSVSEAPV